MDTFKLLLQHRDRSAGLCGKIDNYVFRTLSLFRDFYRKNDVITFIIKDGEKKLILGDSGHISGPLLLLQEDSTEKPICDLFTKAKMYVILEHYNTPELPGTEFEIPGNPMMVLYSTIISVIELFQNFTLTATILSDELVRVKFEKN